MDRKYTAFISYRHLPLDTAVAQQLHRLIERYRVPKDLRKNGQKHLGLVFRDRDELPLSSDLTRDIYTALDNSEYLIVICTPETPKSLWVRQEIEHFIRVHGRDRVLTVLAAGTMEESVPDCITAEYAADGTTVTHRIEPLCAFLVDDTPKKTLRNLRSEFLRLAAAILGCPYDSLKQRQKRYRTQQAMGALGAVAVFAMMVIGILVRWNLDITEKNGEISGLNQQIQTQLEQTQLNESKALTLLSENYLADGNRIDAIQNALAALEGQRPYYAPAEAALAEALYIYKPAQYRSDVSFEVPSDFSVPYTVFSNCGRYAIIDDCNYTVLFDLNTRKEKWRVTSPSSYHERHIFIHSEQQFFILQDPDFGYILSFETGEIIYEFSKDYQSLDILGVSPDASLAAIKPRKENGAIVLFDAANRKEVLRFAPECNIYRGDFSDDGRYLLLFGSSASEYILYLMDLYSGDMQELSLPGYIADCAVMPHGQFILLSEIQSDMHQFFKLNAKQKHLRSLSDAFSLDQKPAQLLTHDQWLYCVSEKMVYIFSRHDGNLRKRVSLEGYPLNSNGGVAAVSPEGSLLLARHNGLYLVTSKLLYDGSYRWSCNQIYSCDIDRIFFGNSRIAFTTGSQDKVQFLAFCADANATSPDIQSVAAAAPQADWDITADFDGKILTLKDNSDGETQKIACPYQAEDDLYIRRTFSERFGLDYNTGVAEMYYGQNGIVILGYYEGGYQPEDMAEFDTPESYMIYSAKHDGWNRFEDDSLQDASIGIFMMNHRPGFAMVSGTNTLKLYDFDSNSVTLELHPELTYLSGVRFSQDDRYLLAFDTTRAQSILYDLADGTAILRLNETPYLYDDDFYLHLDEHKIYIEQLSNDSAGGIILDKNSQTVLARIPDMEYYDPETNRIICKRDDGTLIAYPAYTTQDLIALAKQILSGES